jgi:hypothetical protein
VSPPSRRAVLIPVVLTPVLWLLGGIWPLFRGHEPNWIFLMMAPLFLGSGLALLRSATKEDRRRPDADIPMDADSQPR